MSLHKEGPTPFPEHVPHLIWFVYTLPSSDTILPSWLLCFVLFLLEICELPGGRHRTLAPFSLPQSKKRIDLPLGTGRAQSTLNPHVDTLTQRDRMGESRLLDRKAEGLRTGEGRGGHGSLALDRASCPLDLATLLGLAQLRC